MNKILKVFTNDMKKISTNVIAVVIILGLSILPSLYAWFNIFSNWDPYGPSSTGNIKVAVVSDDAGAEISGLEINIGATVVEALQANNTIGWVFTDNSDETIEGVKAGDYYAALVIPETFSEDMVSFLTGDLEHPQIIYYENGKKNAIAPKITQKAQKTVRQQVNATFISTLAESAMKAGNVISATDSDGVSIADTMTEKLTALSSDMDTYINILSSFKGIMDSAQSIISTTKIMLPSLNTVLDSSKTSLSSMQTMVNSSTNTVNTVSDMMLSSLDMIDGTLTMISNVVNSDLSSAQTVSTIVLNGIGAVNNMIPYAKEIFNSSVAGIEAKGDEKINSQINAIRGQFDLVKSDADHVGSSSAVAVSNSNDLIDKIQAELAHCSNDIAVLKDTYSSSVKPQLSSTVTNAQAALNTTVNALSSFNLNLGSTDNVLTSYSDTLADGNTNLDTTLELAQELSDYIKTLTENMSELSDNENYNKLIEVMDSNPELLGEFASSPVSLDTVRIYPIENYGSAMAPFYTVLALWVGALILVAIIHVKVHPIPGVSGICPRHAYFGRYMLFFLVGQLQTLITVLGDLHFIGIQCEHPVMFWFAGAMCSFVFTLFIYSLTVALGNIGEALAVVVMVVQVAGAGCTFPIETLPKVFHSLYNYLPFQFGMNAMKETIGGLYENSYWTYIAKLSVYLLVSLFIGLVGAIPFRKLNKIIDKNKEKSGIMI
jgi:putative membrane protein